MGVGRGFVEMVRNIEERCWFRRDAWRLAAESCGRVRRDAGPPLLNEALIAVFEARGSLVRMREALGQVPDARGRAPACRESMALDVEVGGNVQYG